MEYFNQHPDFRRTLSMIEGDIRRGVPSCTAVETYMGTVAKMNYRKITGARASSDGFFHYSGKEWSRMSINKRIRFRIDMVNSWIWDYGVPEGYRPTNLPDLSGLTEDQTPSLVKSWIGSLSRFWSKIR